jgi:inner membrane protein
VASLGHLAVGMAAARIYGADPSPRRVSLTAILFWSAVSFLPDADVIGFSLGVQYADEWGHRGATHSFAFSLVSGAAIGLAAPLVGRSRLRTGFLASLVLASHALLDTLTDGGLGCALFWPFDLTRYFAPWTPIPVSPIGLSFFSPYGLFVATTELLLFAPIVWLALRSRTRPSARRESRWRRLPALLIAVWVLGLWLFMSGDPVRERIVRVMLRDNTEFAPGFSEGALASVARGDSAGDVRTRLGPPFSEFLLYDDVPEACVAIQVEREQVVMSQPPELCRTRGVQPAMARTAVIQALGVPRETCWEYSRSPDRGFFRARGVCFTDDRVRMIVRRWIRD